MARSIATAALAGAQGLPLPADVDPMDRVAAMGLSKGTRRDGGAEGEKVWLRCRGRSGAWEKNVTA